MLDDKEALMILDGLYGVFQEIINNTNNQLLKNDLGFFIIRHLKMLLLRHGLYQEKFFNNFEGVVLDKEHLKKYKKEWREKMWQVVLTQLNSKKF